MALKRPMAAALPTSRYLNGTSRLSPLSRRRIVFAACRPPCIATSQTPGSLSIDAMSPTANTSGCPGRLRSGRTAMRPARSVVGPGRLGEQTRQGRRLNARRPDVGARRDPLLAVRAVDVHTEGVHADDATCMRSSTPRFSSACTACRTAGRRRRRAARRRRRRRMTRTDAGSIAAEILRQAPHRQLSHLAGELDAGRTAADDDDRQPAAARSSGRAPRPSRTPRRRDAAAPARRRSSSSRERSARTRRDRSRTAPPRRRR